MPGNTGTCGDDCAIPHTVGGAQIGSSRQHDSVCRREQTPNCKRASDVSIGASILRIGTRWANSTKLRANAGTSFAQIFRDCVTLWESNPSVRMAILSKRRRAPSVRFGSGSPSACRKPAVWLASWLRFETSCWFRSGSLYHHPWCLKFVLQLRITGASYSRVCVRGLGVEDSTPSPAHIDTRFWNCPRAYFRRDSEAPRVRILRLGRGATSACHNPAGLLIPRSDLEHVASSDLVPPATIPGASSLSCNYAWRR